MTDLLPWLMAITVNLTGLPAVEQPQVIRLPAEWLRDYVCGEPCPGLVAYYDHQNKAVLYSDTLDPESDLTDASFIVHEFAHALQYAAHGEPMACEDVLADEREAYEIQNRFLARTGQLYRAGVMLLGAKCDGQLIAVSE